MPLKIESGGRGVISTSDRPELSANHFIGARQNMPQRRGHQGVLILRTVFVEGYFVGLETAR